MTTDATTESSDAADPSYETVTARALVVGAGAAGVRAAIELVQRGVSPEDVLVIGKRAHGDAHTTWARGGINGSLGTRDPEDDPAIHAADTLKEGHFVNDPEKVATLAREAPARLRELEEWGMDFSRTDDGEIDQRYFGAQSFRRTAFAGDHTGESLLDTLIGRARDLGIPYREHVMVTQLVTDDAGDRVLGAAGYDQDTGDFLLFDAESVVLAAGGYTSVYGRHSSRDEENTGDGPALALAAGARLADMEFVQFHPTGMVGGRYGASWDGRLVTEAVRGEGGRLYNADGERFMERYSPKQMELDARDVVARAIAREIAEGRGTENGGVYLDISGRDRAFVEERLPRMTERFDSLGVDLSAEAVEVAPTAHYGMGGVVVDGEGETDVAGLYAVGETMAGVHGANRLGGNSLAETVVFGRVAGAAIARRLQNGDLPPRDTATLHDRARDQFADLAAATDRDGVHDPAAVFDDLRTTMWDHAGILRDEAGLEAGLSAVADLRERAANVRTGDRTGQAFETALNLGNALTVAETVLRTALERAESRGAHHRTDFSAVDPDWQQTLTVGLDSVGGFVLSTETVGDPDPEIRAALDAGHELDYHQLE